MCNKTTNGGTAQVLQRCVSLANGALSPDQRVNYTFGLILGVDEFQQEQLYFLEKERLHQRSLHGYGTVYGLRVTAPSPADDSDERLVTVEPGLAVDQFGRTVVVRNAQCARLGAWLARQVQDGKAPPVGSEEDYRAYVVLSYDECEDALVPVPGEPCSSSDITEAPSRIRDSFRIELRWDWPSMTAWDAVRAFGDLLARVQLVPGLAPGLSDEATITGLVRGLSDPPEMPPCGGGGSGSPPDGSPPADHLFLPLETARAALDRIMTVWVTEVRPQIRRQVNLTDPGDDTKVESGILLACIDFSPLSGYDVTAGKIDHANVSDEGRPFLLHTQLMQELLPLGNGALDQPERLFATLQVRGSHRVRAWVHHPAALDVLAPAVNAVRVEASGRVLNVKAVTPVGGTTNVVDIDTAAAKADRILPGDRVTVEFRLDRLQEQGGLPLPEALKDAGYRYLDQTEDIITAFTTADLIVASRDLASFNAELAGEFKGVQLVAWFHLDDPVGLPDTIAAVRISDGTRLTLNTRPRPLAKFSYQWELTPQEPDRLAQGDLLVLQFPTTQVKVKTAQQTLGDLIAEETLSILGYDGDHTVYAFARVDLPPVIDIPEPEPIDYEKIIREVLAKIRALPFVTIIAENTTWEFDKDKGPEPVVGFELWFHLDVDPVRDVMAIKELPQFKVFGEIEAAVGSMPELFSLELVRNPQHNVFYYVVRLTAFEEELQGSQYLRFIFGVEENTVVNRETQDQGTLKDHIRANTIKFVGHNGGDTIVAYVRVPDIGEQ